MAQDRDELYTRRDKRAQIRQKQLREQRRVRITLLAAAVIAAAVGLGIFLLSRGAGEQQATAGVPQAQNQPTMSATQATEPSQEPTETTQGRRNPLTVINIKAAGDLNVTNSVVEAGLSASGYDYTRAFMDVAPILADAELTLMNFEGNICGEPYGTERTSAPWQILEGLRRAGVDVLQTANSCAINNGLIGMSSTLQAIQASGLTGVGAYATAEDWRRSGGYTILEIQGIKIGIVAFTKGVGGMGLPSGNEDLVNVLYKDYYSTYDKLDTDRINKTLDRLNNERPDITIAMLHWGSEYNDVISESQEDIVAMMQKKGVDVIIGTHPHLVQKVEYDELKGTLVAYSLGDFFGDGTRGGSNYSIILDLEITKDSDTGVTKVTGWDYVPIYTLKGSDCDGYQRVVRIREAMLAYENNFVDKVTASCYADMQYSLGRITARLAGDGQTEEKD